MNKKWRAKIIKSPGLYGTKADPIFSPNCAWAYFETDNPLEMPSNFICVPLDNAPPRFLEDLEHLMNQIVDRINASLNVVDEIENTVVGGYAKEN